MLPSHMMSDELLANMIKSTEKQLRALNKERLMLVAKFEKALIAGDHGVQFVDRNLTALLKYRSEFQDSFASLSQEQNLRNSPDYKNVGDAE